MPLIRGAIRPIILRRKPTNIQDSLLIARMRFAAIRHVRLRSRRAGIAHGGRTCFIRNTKNRLAPKLKNVPATTPSSAANCLYRSACQTAMVVQ
jgi:hypothetical protein